MFLSADCVPLIRTTSLLLLFFSFFCLLFLTHLKSINYHSKASDELIKPLPLLLLMRWNILQPVGLSSVLSFCFLVQRARLVKIRKIIVIIIMAQKISPHWARGKPVSPTVLHQDRQLRKCVYKSPHLPLPSPPFFCYLPLNLCLQFNWLQILWILAAGNTFRRSMISVSRGEKFDKHSQKYWKEDFFYR